MLGQDVGFPVPEGGAGMLATALRRRAESLGVQVRCGVPVTEVRWSGGRAPGCGSPTATSCGRATRVLADVPAPALYRDLVGAAPPPAAVPGRRAAASSGTTRRSRSTGPSTPPSRGRRRERGGPARCTSASTTTASSTWPPTSPWDGCRRHPFMLLGQMTTADPTRSPEGTESAWAYTHLPRRLAGRRGSGRPSRSSASRRPSSGWRRGSSRPRRGPPGADPARPPGRRRQPEPRRPQRRHRGPAPAAGAAAHPGPRPSGDAGARASTSPAPRPTPVAGSTAPAGGTPPSRPAATAVPLRRRAARHGPHGLVAGAARARAADPVARSRVRTLVAGEPLAVAALGDVGQPAQGLAVARQDHRLPQPASARAPGPARRVLGDRHRAAAGAVGHDLDLDPRLTQPASPRAVSTRWCGSSASFDTRRVRDHRRPRAEAVVQPGAGGGPALVDGAHPGGPDHPGGVLPPVGEHRPHGLGRSSDRRQTRGRDRAWSSDMASSSGAGCWGCCRRCPSSAGRSRHASRPKVRIRGVTSAS